MIQSYSYCSKDFFHRTHKSQSILTQFQLVFSTLIPVLDQEYNDGSAARPYHMTSTLRRMLRRRRTKRQKSRKREKDSEEWNEEDWRQEDKSQCSNSILANGHATAQAK